MTRQARDLKDCARAWVFPYLARELIYSGNNSLLPGRRSVREASQVIFLFQIELHCSNV
jgi:hypothetical protein